MIGRNIARICSGVCFGRSGFQSMKSSMFTLLPPHAIAITWHIRAIRRSDRMLP